MNDAKQLWEAACAEIELDVSKANFATWFKNTSIVRRDDDAIHLAVPNTFVKDWLYNKYHKLILKALRNNAPTIKAVEYIITKEPTGETLHERTMPREELFSDQLKFNELYVSSEDNLNPKYVFDSFIVGPFNELAFAASQAVVKSLGTSYNPLYIYGGTGLGKTHLIQSIGNFVKKNSGKKVCYITSERYATELVDSLREGRPHHFKEKYRKYDLLIIDDIQFIGGKEKSQEEIFHLFNFMYEKNKQIIFSSDKPPKSILGLEERLRSRFEGGMIVDISKPDYESRLAILRAKTHTASFSPTDEVIEYIASVVQDSIRELEGIFNTIIVQCQLKTRNLTLAEVKNLIKNNTKPTKAISFKDIVKIVASFYNIEERMLFEKTRRKEVVKPRQVVMYILREDFATSYPSIGQKLGGRDHTTVIHACEKIRNDIRNDSLLSQEIEQIKSILFSSYPQMPVGQI